MANLRVSSFLILLLAPVSRCIQFIPLPYTSTSSTLALNWTRNVNEPKSWGVVPIFSSLEHDQPLIFEFEPISHPYLSSGVVEIPVSMSTNITLLTVSLNFVQKNGQFSFEGMWFGQNDVQTFDVTIFNNSLPQVGPGILPPAVANMLQTSKSKTPIILGAVLGPVGFLLLLSALFFFYRRRSALTRAREQFHQEHEVYRSMPPEYFARHPNERRASVESTSTWSVPPAKEQHSLPTHISPALALRATAAPPSSSDRVPIRSSNSHSLPSFPSSTLPPDVNTVFDPRLSSDRQNEVERAIARLRKKTSILQSQFTSSDRDTTEGIEDEVTIIQVKLEMERLKRLLNSEWAHGLTDEIPSAL